MLNIKELYSVLPSFVILSDIQMVIGKIYEDRTEVVIEVTEIAKRRLGLF